MDTLHIGRPAAGESQSFPLEAGQTLTLGFNASSADASRIENDLAFRFDGGSEVRIDDFFVTGDKALPAFVLEDGTQVAGADLLRQLDGDMNLETAAGPAAGPNAGSGGSGEYTDESAALIGGVERLGSLGTDFWERGTEAPEFAPAAAAVAALDAPDAAVTPPPAPEIREYSARAVLYASENDGEPTFRFRLMNMEAIPPRPYTAGELTPEVLKALLANLQSEYVDIAATVNEDGTLSGTLNQAGLDALAANGGENLYDYITFTDGDNSYTMQLVVNQNGSYDSAAEDEKNPPLGGAPVWGEWHTETDFTSGSAGDERATGAGNDEFWFRYAQGEVFTGQLETGAGDDSVRIDGRVGAYDGGKNSIQTGAGDDTVTITGSVTSRNYGKNTTDMGADDDTLNVTGKLLAETGGTILLDGGAGNDTINVTGTVSAAKGGTASIKAGDGNDKVSLNGNLSSTGNGSALIDGGAGDDRIEVKGYVDGGSIRDDAANSGDNIVIVNSEYSYALKNSVISTGGGADTVYVKNSPNAAIGASGENGLLGGLIDTGTGADQVRVSGILSGVSGNSANAGITAEDGDITILAEGKGNATSAARGVSNENGHEVGIVGKTVDIRAGYKETAPGVDANGDWLGGFEKTGALGNANAVLSMSGASTVISGDDVRLYADSSGTRGTANGLYAEGNTKGGGKNVVNAGDVSIETSSTLYDAVGMSAVSGGSNIIQSAGDESLNVRISATGARNADAMLVNASGTPEALAEQGTANEIIGGTGDDTVSLTGDMRVVGIAAGKPKGGEGHNLIRTGAGADTVSIDGKLYADGKGHANIIETGAGNDTINVTGTVSAAKGGGNVIDLGGGTDTLGMGGMSATGGGVNEIVTAGNLTISGGTIQTGANSETRISAGTEDNRITVNASFSNTGGGKLVIDTGGGTDTLTLARPFTPGAPGDYSYAEIRTGGAGDDSLTINSQYGITANKNNDNLITTDSGADGPEGNDSLFINATLKATAGGSNRILTGDGNDSVTINTGPFDALFADGAGARNEIRTGDGFDSITLNGDIYTMNGGKSVIDAGQQSGGAGADSVTVNGLLYNHNSSNAIISHDVRVTGSGNADTNEAMYTCSEKSEHVSSIDASGDVTFRLTNSYFNSNADITVISAHVDQDSGAVAKNLIEADGAVNITAANVSANATGGVRALYAENTGAQNVLDAKTITIKGDSAGEVTLLHATSGGVNTLTAAEAISLDAGGTKANDKALLAAAGGRNSLELTSAQGGRVNVRGNIEADKGDNSIRTGAGDDTVFLDGTVLAKAGGGNVIDLGSSSAAGRDSLTFQSMTADGADSVNSITGSGNLDVTAKQFLGTASPDSSIASKAGGKTYISTDDGGSAADTLTITARLGASGANSELHVRTGAGDDVITIDGISAHGSGGILAKDGGTVSVEAGAGKDTVSVTGNLIAESGGTARIDGGADNDSITVDGRVDGGYITGGAGDDAIEVKRGMSGGTIEDRDGKGTIVVTGTTGLEKGSGIATGAADDTVYVSGSKENAVIDSHIDSGAGAGDEVRIAGIMNGVNANGGDASVKARDGEITILASGGNKYTAQGVSSSFGYDAAIDGATVNIYAGYAEDPANADEHGRWGDIVSSNTTRAAYAMISGSGSTGSVNAHEVNLFAANSGTAAASGLYAAGTAKGIGHNVITAAEVHMEVSSGKGDASGMHADGGSSNLITAAAGGGLTVEIICASGGADRAYAMWANSASLYGDSDMSRNEILGSGSGDSLHLVGGMKANGNHASLNLIRTFDGDDTVHIEGNLRAEKAGQENRIETGAGDDLVHIEGDVLENPASSHWTGDNVIDTGADNDTIWLHGDVNGKLTVQGGQGYDTLILEAGDGKSLSQCFGDWLGQDLSGLAGMGVESVTVIGGSPADLDWFRNAVDAYTSNPANSGNTIAFGYEEGGVYRFLGDHSSSDALYDLLDSGSLADIAGTGGSLTKLTLDFSGDDQDTLDLDALLGHIYDDKGNKRVDTLTINGDGQDSVTGINTAPGGPLTLVGPTESGYTQYEYRPAGAGGDEILTVLIQSDLV